MREPEGFKNGNSRMKQRTLLLLLAWCLTGGYYRAEAVVLTLDIDDIIHPVMAEFAIKGLTQAQEEGAVAIILRLSTPGGFDQSMREIIEKILQSEVPVITYVGPSGARAASAGFFILLSGDLAVMAPGTNTGAAHPVPLLGGQVDEVMKKKIENDAAAYIRSFVVQRGRNAKLAEKGVLESISLTEGEALEGNLIDGLAQDFDDLLTKFHGKEIQRFDGKTHILQLKGESLRKIEMSSRQKVLSKILNPNVALILGLIGLLGIYIEFSNPGLLVPGGVGALCVVLALVAFNILPVNTLGAVLILAAIVLFVLEVKMSSYGLLAIAGLISMVLGSLILIDSPLPEMRVQLGTAVGITLPFMIITIFLMRMVILVHRTKSVTGKEGMVGEIGTALTDFAPEGKVKVHGEIWGAQSVSEVSSGDRVRILAVEGLKLKVTEESDS